MLRMQRRMGGRRGLSLVQMAMLALGLGSTGAQVVSGFNLLKRKTKEEKKHETTTTLINDTKPNHFLKDIEHRRQQPLSADQVALLNKILDAEVIGKNWDQLRIFEQNR